MTSQPAIALAPLSSFAQSNAMAVATSCGLVPDIAPVCGPGSGIAVLGPLNQRAICGSSCGASQSSQPDLQRPQDPCGHDIIHPAVQL
eukprot:scaffold608796_cov50-Prasinocladus_malaysianus.AAC.1